MSDYVGITFFSILLVSMIVMIIAMFVTMAKVGDERRKKILEKASTNTLAITVGYILFFLIEQVVKSLTQGISAEGMNPLIVLTVIALMYFIQLIYFKKKYGD